MKITMNQILMRESLQHNFVEYIPEQLEEGILYISVQFKTAVHMCICGCGNKVVTPITPNDWKLTFDGKSVTLYPSVGNWSFPCKTHYFITNNKIEIMPMWSQDRIESCRKDEQRKKKRYFKWRKNKKNNE